MEDGYLMGCDKNVWMSAKTVSGYIQTPCIAAMQLQWNRMLRLELPLLQFPTTLPVSGVQPA